MASIHGNDLGDVWKKHGVERDVLQEVFQRFIVLSWERNGRNVKQRWEISDGDGKVLGKM